MSRVLLVSVALAAALIASGCATLAKVLTPAAQPALQAAVTLAVAGAVAKGVPVAKITAISSQVCAIGVTATTSVAALEADVNGLIAKSGLPPADVPLAQILNMELVAAVNAYVANGTTAGQALSTASIAVSDVCSAIALATGGIVPAVKGS